MKPTSALIGLCLLTVACSSPEQADAQLNSAPASASSTTRAAAEHLGTNKPDATTTSTTSPSPPRATKPPIWLGTRVLEAGPDGRIAAQQTPPPLEDRRLITTDELSPPQEDEFSYVSEPLRGQPLAESTWHPGCPVDSEDLRLITLSHWGFDGTAHTGQIVVHESVALDVVDVFGQLFDARFPIEQMRNVTDADLAAPPTGDNNTTAAFVCRAVTGGTSFSEHAYGLAIDVNPFHNPYVNDQWILPELASGYADRSNVRQGMIEEGDTVTAVFDAIGWGWGGRWQSLKDYQHFSLHNR
jgi:hypothetical protein